MGCSVHAVLGRLSHMDIRARRMVLALPTSHGSAPKERGDGFGISLPTLLLSCPVGSGTLLWLFATSPVSHGFFWGLGTTGEDEGLGTLSCPCGVAGGDWAPLAAQISKLLADGGSMPLLLGSRG